MTVDWDAIAGSYESHPSFKMKKGEKKTVIFQDDGKAVDKKTLEKAGSPFPKPSYVFFIKDEKGNEYDWWVAQTSFGVLNQLKAIRGPNGLTGVKAEIKRVSDNATETNYEIKKL